MRHLTRPAASARALPRLGVFGALCLLGCFADALPEREAALETWAELDAAAETPGTYWYEDHNCHEGWVGGTATVVQVTNGVPSVVGERTVCDENCEPGIGRYEDFLPATLPELIEACSAGSTVDFDANGVLTLCRFRPRGCIDACEFGHHIVQWEHGVFDGDATVDQECEP
jgi:hypothetical protein